jgi:hypothetical protein
MPRKTDHRKAREELAKLAPDALQAVTVRLPAGLLIGVHKWAEQRGLDLATTIRELTALGQQAADRPGGQLSAADRRAIKRWSKLVEQALRAGRSPLEPFLGEDRANVELLPAILGSLDYGPILQQVKATSEKAPWIEQAWTRKKANAPAHVRPLMESLDELERQFRARKKLYSREKDEGFAEDVHWLFSDAVMRALGEESSDDDHVEAVRQLIAARYLIPPPAPDGPWEFIWDE